MEVRYKKGLVMLRGIMCSRDQFSSTIVLTFCFLDLQGPIDVGCKRPSACDDSDKLHRSSTLL